MSFLTWIAESTIYATLLVVLIFILKATIGKWMSPRWHYWIWLIVFGRLILPVAPESRFSINSLWTNLTVENPEPAGARSITGYFPAEQIDHTPGSRNTVDRGTARGNSQLNLSNILLLAWATGTLACMAIFALHWIRLSRMIRQGVVIEDDSITAVLDECREVLKIPQMVRLLSSSDVNGPVLAGVVRPAILLPASTIQNLTGGEMRDILMHELIHLRRNDIPVGMAVGLLQALHWFNPFVWLAGFHMRQDRELACDWEVVSALGDENATGYARTILNLAEHQTAKSRTFMGAVGIIEKTSATGKRIKVITRFKGISKSRAWTGVGIGVILIAAGFTKAQSPSANGTGAVTTAVLEMPQIEPAPDKGATHVPDPKTSSMIPFRMPSFDSQNPRMPFRLTVDENVGILTYTFDQNTKELATIVAEKGVVLSTAGTTISSAILNYNVTSDTLTAQGPGLIVEFEGLTYKAEKLVYHPKLQMMELQENVTIIQKDSGGKIIMTSGDHVTISPENGKPRTRVTKGYETRIRRPTDPDFFPDF